MINTITQITHATSDADNMYIDLVKEHISEDMLNIKQFIKITNYNIDPLIVDEQWAILNTRRPDEMIPLTQQMLQRLNFCRTPTLIKKLEQLFPAPRGENNEYWGDDVNVSIILLAPTGTSKIKHGGVRNFKQIKMTKGAYKQLVMETQTEAAKLVRKYYICLEELFVQYLMYQRAYELMKSQISVTLLTNENTNLSTKLDIVIHQNENMAHQLEIQTQQMQIQTQKLDLLSKILYKESDDKVLDVTSSHKKQELVVLRNKTDPDKCEVLRGQRNHVQSQLKRKQKNMEVVGKVETYKNPINLYNRFSENTKKQKDERFTVINNKVTLKNGTTPNELLNMFHHLDDQKHSVAEQVKNTF